VRAFFRREGRNFDHPVLTYILSFTLSSFLLSLKEERRAVYVRNVSLVVILFLFHFSLVAATRFFVRCVVGGDAWDEREQEEGKKEACDLIF